MNRTDYNRSALNQQHVIKHREEALKILNGNPRALKALDAKTLNDLCEVSPKKLQRVFVKRASSWEDIFAAFLVSRTRSGGYRLLLRSDPWRIISVRQSADVRLIGTEHAQIHEKVCVLQAEIESRLNKWRTVKSKGSRVLKSKKQKFKSM